MMDRATAEKYTILRAPCGSNLHGLALPGRDDDDEMGVMVEDLANVAGFTEFEQYIYRSAAEREGRHDAPSQPGDLDLTIYGLRKFLRLAMQGNPQLLQLLFTPVELCSVSLASGRQLQELAPYIVSKQAGGRYLGYLEAQRQRLLGERGQKKTNRPELEAKYGFDTKYAMHIVRLAFQGVELLSTGKLTLPMPVKQREFTFAVRCGQVPLQDVLTTVGGMEREIRDLITDGPIRDQPDREVVESWMLNHYFEIWKCRRFTSVSLFEKEAQQCSS